jgi:hypothetical protein
LTGPDLLEAAKAFFTKPFDGVVRIELGEESDNAIWVDGRTDPPKVSNTSPANVVDGFCLWSVRSSDLSMIFGGGERRLESAFVAGRLKLSGDMSVMARMESPDE